MRDYRFYEEFTDKTRKIATGNVIAAIVANGVRVSDHEACYDAFGAIYYCEDSPVAGTSVSLSYLAECCKRVSEARAREIHPELFRRLDDSD